MGFGGRVCIAGRAARDGRVRRGATRGDHGGAARAWKHDAPGRFRGRALRRGRARGRSPAAASRAKPKPQGKRVERALTVRPFIFSMMSSVAADMATTPVRRAALTEKAEALNALTGAPYAT